MNAKKFRFLNNLSVSEVYLWRNNHVLSLVWCAIQASNYIMKIFQVNFYEINDMGQM